MSNDPRFGKARRRHPVGDSPAESIYSTRRRSLPAGVRGTSGMRIDPPRTTFAIRVWVISRKWEAIAGPIVWSWRRRYGDGPNGRIAMNTRLNRWVFGFGAALAIALLALSMFSASAGAETFKNGS